MKYVVAMMLCFSLNSVQANHHEGDDKAWDKMSFEDAKKMKLEKADRMSSMMEEYRKCLNDAKDKDGLKTCKSKMYGEKKDMKKKKKDKKKK